MKTVKIVTLVGGILIGTFSPSGPARGEQVSPPLYLSFGYALVDSTSAFQADRVWHPNSLFGPTSYRSHLMSPFLRLGGGNSVAPGSQSLPDRGSKKRSVDYKRAGPLGAANAGAVFCGIRKAVASWGESKGSFHFKDDWEGDHLAQIDELSHFMWGYKMTQFLFWSYHWAGFSSKTSHLISISQTAFVLTMVEYPIDAYNPKQGLGLSDLAFDYAGIGLAYLKRRCRGLGDFDVKISYRRDVVFGNQPVFAQTYDQFDNFIYWLTYRTGLFLPQKALCFGFGYGVTHRQDQPTRHFLVGIGLSLPDFVSLFAEDLGARVRFLELFYPNLNLQF